VWKRWLGVGGWRRREKRWSERVENGRRMEGMEKIRERLEGVEKRREEEQGRHHDF